MHLTRRGYGVVAIVVFAELAALTYGGRSLNAIAAPALIALVAGYVQLRRAEDPVADREPVEPGFPGETRDVTVDLSGSGVAAVTQPLLDADEGGVTATDTEQSLSLPGEFTFTLEYNGRGKYRLGPLEVTVMDTLGLVAETHETGETTGVTVYPPVYQIAGRQRFLHDVLDERDVERDEFDALREYTSGDPLRDVHWKSSAKEPDTLYVKQFVDRRINEDVVVVATGDPGYGDEMATAAASVAVLALDADLSVELHVGRATVAMGQGVEQRTRIFEMLAEVEAAPLPDEREVDADVRIHAGADGVEMTLGTRTSTLEELTVSRQNPLTAGEARA